jgi:hypothetical protein
MSAPTTVNFGARQNKAIERAAVFDGLSMMKSQGLLDSPVYVGFGSVWFADFHLAHRMIGIDRLISIESDEVKFSRAKFNRPFKNVEVLHGTSGDLLPQLLNDASLSQRPWVIWLDYDRSLFVEELTDLQTVVAEIPAGSVLLTTFNARKTNYNANATDKSTRVPFLRELFGEDLTADLDLEAVDRQPDFYATIAGLVQDAIQSRALNSGHDGGYVPMFDIKYSDGVEMLTVGGYFPSAANRESSRALAAGAGWPGIQGEAISLPSLTMKEVMAIRSLLPTDEPLSRESVASSLGFELQESAITGFAKHYLRFPVFSDVAHVL